MKRLLLVLACSALLGAAAPPSSSSFVELFKQAGAAHEAKDYALMELRLRQALQQRPVHPAAMYELAAALALKGEAKGSLEILETLGAMGLAYDPAADADFAALKGSERFADAGKTFARNARPGGAARTAVQLTGRASFIPTAVAYDEGEDQYYVGSARERRIQRAARGSKKDSDFVKPGEGGLWGVFGMAVDSNRRQLWVATDASAEMDEPDPKARGQAALLTYDLRSGAQTHRYVLGEPGEHHFGNLVLTRSGTFSVKDTVYVTDSAAGLVYAFDGDTGKFEALTKPGELVSPQGLATARDRRTLYIADYTQGLFRYDLYTHELRRMEVGRDICVYGIGALALYKDHLVAVQDGVRPQRVVQLELDDRGRRVRFAHVIASNLPWFDDPAGAVVTDNHLDFIANSQWGKLDGQRHLPKGANLQDPLVLRLDLEDLRRRSDDGGRQDDPFQQQQQQQQPQRVLPCIGPTCR